MIVRGLGSPVVYGPTDAQLMGANFGTVFPGGSLPDQVNTCVSAGGPLTDCVAAVLSTNTSSSGLPAWALPVGIGVLGLLLVKAFSR